MCQTSSYTAPLRRRLHLHPLIQSSHKLLQNTFLNRARNYRYLSKKHGNYNSPSKFRQRGSCGEWWIKCTCSGTTPLVNRVVYK